MNSLARSQCQSTWCEASSEGSLSGLFQRPTVGAHVPRSSPLSSPQQLQFGNISALLTLSHCTLPSAPLQREGTFVGLNKPPCATLKSPKTQSDICQVGFLHCWLESPEGKSVPKHGQGTHSQGIQKLLLAEECKASYIYLILSLTFSSSKQAHSIPTWFSHHESHLR